MELDLAINDGSVIDTEKRRRRPLNVGIRGDKIVAVTAQKLKAKRVIDACGLIVSPGFIDVHAHLDGDAYGGELAACQGITTSIGGNCGLSPIEMEDFFKRKSEMDIRFTRRNTWGIPFPCAGKPA
ncbi:MAG: amidohydrolase family protein [Clostridia bacterium]